MTLLIPKGQSHRCHFCTGLKSFIHNLLFNCPPGFAWRPAADRHLVYGSHIQWQHSLKKRTLVHLITLWMTFSTREKQAIVWAKGWEAGEPEEAAAPVQPPKALKRARRATILEQENLRLSSTECPTSQGPSQLWGYSLLWKEWVLSKLKQEAKANSSIFLGFEANRIPLSFSREF